MKIAVVGGMNPAQQLLLDKMIANGHEIVYIGEDDSFTGMDMDFCIVDECSGYTSRHASYVKEVKKPYYRVKERY